jgi:putative transposase
MHSQGEMTYDPAKHHRRSIRLRGYDYRQAGAYFVTMVTHQRQCLFGEIVDGQMWPSRLGKIVREEWSLSTQIRHEIELDAFVLMPNHVHGIVIIRDQPAAVVGAHGRAPLQHRPPRSLGSLVAGFKSIVTRRINGIRRTPGAPVWQRNYHEHVVRSEEELNRIQQYVIDNPLHWEEDPENPANAAARREAPQDHLP